MIDRAWAARANADPALPWREQLEHHARQAWAMYERYPWMIRANLWRMPLGPHVLDSQEDLYRAVRQTGLPPSDVVRVAVAAGVVRVRRRPRPRSPTAPRPRRPG